MKYVILLLLTFSSLHLEGINNSDLLFKKMLLEEDLSRMENENEKFKNALAFRESSHRPEIVNHIGAMGLYQFMPRTLKCIGLGHITLEKFKRDPSIFPKTVQDSALYLKISKDIKLLQYQWFRDTASIDYIQKAKDLNFSMGGIIAACHLGGAGGLMRFLDLNKNPRDLYGTSISSYLYEFSKFEYYYIEIITIKTQLRCLNDSLDSSVPAFTNRLKLFTLIATPLMEWYTKSNDMETALTFHYRQITHQNQHSGKLITSLLELDYNYQNTIEEYYFSEAQQQNDTQFPVREVSEKLSGIMQDNGTDRYKLIPIPKKHIEVLDCSNFTLSRYGMLLGTLNYLTYFQNLS